jgi:DHA2 family multidrug resistance protein
MTDAATPATETRAAAPPPLTGVKLVLFTMSAALSLFIVVLDLTIANVSVPTIAAGMGASPREGTWVITSYAVADAVTVLLSGWLAARFGTIRVLIFSIMWFCGTSIMCGLSTSLDMLVIFRILQGIAGGPMVPISQTLILTSFPKERAQYGIAIWTAMSVLGPILGPVIGGYICDNYPWRWIFFINIPVCIFAAVSLWRLTRDRIETTQKRPIDYVGMLLMATAVGALQFMLDRGHDLDWFSSPMIVGLAILSGVAFIAFLMWELTDEHPFIDLGIFRTRTFTLTMLVFVFVMGPFFGAVIIMPLWLQTNMNYTPTWSGISSSPGGMTMILVSPLVAWLSSRVDKRALVTFGLMAMANAYFWRGHFNSGVTNQLILLTQAGIGMGLAFVMAPLTTMAIAAVKPHQMANVNGLISFLRTLSVAIATSVFVTYWQNAAIFGRAGIADRIEGNATHSFDATGMPHDQAVRLLDGMVQGQSVMLATNQTYITFAVVTLIGIAFIWFTPRSNPRPKAA